MRYSLILFCLVFCQSVIAQTAKQNIRKMQRVYFKHPVEVYVRLNKPVKSAEHRIIMEESLLPHLDTITLSGLVNHPGIFFTKFYSSTVPGQPHRKYQMVGAQTVGDGLYPFDTTRIHFKRIEKPLKGRFYTRIESTQSYSYWLVRKGPTDMGIADKVNTLPGVSSIKVVYVIEIRERWKRRTGNK